MSRKNKNKKKEFTTASVFTPSTQDLANAAVVAAVTNSYAARKIWLKVVVFPMSIISGLIIFPCLFSVLNWDFSFRDVLVCTGLFTWFMMWINNGGSQKYEDT